MLTDICCHARRNILKINPNAVFTNPKRFMHGYGSQYIKTEVLNTSRINSRRSTALTSEVPISYENDENIPQFGSAWNMNK